MNCVDDRSKRKFAKDGEAGTGAANRFASGDMPVNRILYRGVLPEAHVVGLISSGDEDALRMIDDFDDFWVGGIFAAEKGEGCCGVKRADCFDLGIFLGQVGVIVVRAQYQKISAVGALA